MKPNITSAAALLIAIVTIPLQQAPAKGLREADDRLLQGQDMSWQESLNRANTAWRFWLSEQMANVFRPGKGTPGPVATTGPSTWNGGTGNWSDGAMWNPVNPPNSSGADVSVDGGSTGVASAVAVDGNFTVGRLTIDVGDSVTINDTRSLAVVAGAFMGSGTILNNGSLTLGSAGNNTDLRFDGSSVALDGTGTVTMNGSAANRIFGSGGTLTIGANQTIQGGGSLGMNLGKFINNGTVVANNATGALSVDPDAAGGFTNNGVLRANGGTLVLTGNGGGAFINTNGTIEALANSEVQLVSGASVSGGTLSTTGTGAIRGINATLTNLTNNGTFAINDTNTTSLSTGTITNNGNIALNSIGNNTDLNFSGATVSLSGTGTVTMAGSAANRIFGSGGTMTIGTNQTIQGGGSLGINLGKFINNGTILANNSTLSVDPDAAGGFTNNGVMRANGGTLVLTGNGGGVFVNANGMIEALASSEVQLVNGASVSGGTLSTTGSGMIRGISATLTDVTNNGAFAINDTNSTSLAGTIVNNGNIALNSIGNNTDVRFDGGSVVLNGVGTVTMNGNGANRIFGSGGTLTIGANQTIQGGGQLGLNLGTFINNGTILANNATLTVDPDSAGGFTNNNRMRASDGGILLFTGNGGGAFNNSATGVIEALAGSQVQLTNNASIIGGTLSTTGDGLVRLNGGQNGSISNLTNAGNFVVSDNASLTASGTIVNTGSLKLDSSGGNGTDLLISGDTSFTGGGTVTLAASDNARVRAAATGAKLTIGAGQTFAGRGQIGFNDLMVINQGLIDANIVSQALQIDARNVVDGFLNQATMQATNGGVLRFTGNGGGVVNNTGGTIKAVGAGSEVQLTNNASIAGGTLATSNGGVIRENAGQNAFISDLTNAGTFIVNDNSFLHVSGTITNSGSFKLDSAGNGTDILVEADTAFAGTGTVTLAGSFNARVRAGAAGVRLTIGSGQIFAGQGQIGFNDLRVTNLGLINANITGQALQIDAVNTANGFLNQATMQASNGGILLFNGNGSGTVDNTDGTIQAIGAGSEVQLTNSASIIGGILTTSTGGVIRENNGQIAFISDLTNAGTFIVNDNSFLHVSGTITNSGSMKLDSLGNGTDILVDGAATFAGTGAVTLSGSNARVRAGTGALRLTNGAGHTFNGFGQMGFNNLAITNAGLIDANVSGQTLTLDAPNVTDGFLNDTTGILRASNGGTAFLTGNGSGSFTNKGIFEALDGSSITMESNAVLTNNLSGVLTLGSYRSIATGNGATITIRGANITKLAEDTEVILSGAGSVFQVGTTALESTLNMIDGALRILDSRNYTNVNALADNGIMQLGGGIFNAPSLTIGAQGELFGFGSVTPRPTNSGLIRSAGGTLAFADGIQGGSGTVQSDASSTLSVSSGSSASSADFLANNGNLALGANNFTVGLDYTNANFGVGNSFDPRAHVSGGGLILAFGNVAQILTGDVTGGATPNALLAFGNVHVGDSTTLNYQINNAGMMGPVLRGALQTLANGGNVTDGRLGGMGVTASNFGPLALGANTGNLGVTFNATSAGALNGQSVHVINNFDNVGNQDLAITGAAFRFANPTAHTPEPVAFGNFHVGDAVSNVFLSVMNNVPNDGFSESLNGAIGGATGGVLTNGGSFIGLAPGATNNSSLSVGISTATAGSHNGTATLSFQSNGSGSSELGLTTLGSQTVNVTGAVFRYAAPSVHTPEPVTFGIVHVGDTVSGTPLSITNNAANDGFSESLNGSIGSGTNGVTANGSFTGLGAGATNNSSLVVGINTAAAGTRNGTATIGFVSNGAGSSGLGLTTLGSQTVNVTGQVNFYADPVLIFQSGSATLIMNSATSFTLDFGIVQQNSGSYLADLGVLNFLHDATFQDALGGSWDLSMVDSFQLSGFTSFSGIGSGDTFDPSVGFDSGMALGNYANTLLLDPTSSNASGTSNLGTIQLHLQAEIAPVPEPSTWLLLAGGGLGFFALHRSRRRLQRCGRGR